MVLLNRIIFSPFDGNFGDIQENIGHAVKRRIEIGLAAEHAPQGRGLLLQGRFQARLQHVQVATGGRVGNTEALCAYKIKNKASLLFVSTGSFRLPTAADDLGR